MLWCYSKKRKYIKLFDTLWCTARYAGIVLYRANIETTIWYDIIYLDGNYVFDERFTYHYGNYAYDT